MDDESFFKLIEVEVISVIKIQLELLDGIYADIVKAIIKN